jgi:uncharacterized protein
MRQNRFSQLLFATLLLWPGVALGAEPHWPQTLALGTASPGGTYYAYGEGLARILTRALGLPVATRPTDGPNENILLLERGEIDLGFVTQGVALQAWNGSGGWTGGRQLRVMRAMFPMYDTPFQFLVRQDVGVGSLAELAGKRIGVGPRGGTTATYMPDFLKALQLEVTLVNGDWAALAAQTADRGLDGLAVAAGVPFPSFAEIERKTKVRYIAPTRAQIFDLRLAMPELNASTVAAGSYPGLRTHYATVGLFNFAVAHKDLPDDLVYAIVDAVFANQEVLIEAHPAAAETTPANLSRNSFLPFHPGAARWYHNKSAAGVVRGD